MKTAFVILFLSFYILGYTQVDKLKIGTYKTIKYSFSEKLKYYMVGIRYFIDNEKIELHLDSTFQFITSCGEIMTGKWNTKNDSLFLKVFDNTGNPNRLHLYNERGTTPFVPSSPIGFKIRGNYIESKEISKKGEKVISILEFNVP